ncbi:MAG: hypothetical protein KJ070_01250 [Verrucomicrobia bacterium]|nr:hypothetical protein [Verrucomicrobiota bacterium]
MTIATNKQHIAKLLTAEWVRWGRDHRQEYENGIVEAVELLFLEPQPAGGNSKSSTKQGEAAPRTGSHSPSTTASTQAEDEQPEPED